MNHLENRERHKVRMKEETCLFVNIAKFNYFKQRLMKEGVEAFLIVTLVLQTHPALNNISWITIQKIGSSSINKM